MVLNVQAKNTVVSSTAELSNAFNSAQDLDTVSVMPGLYNVGKSLKFPQTGFVVLKSFYASKDSMPIIQMEMSANSVSDDAFEKRPSLIFENLHLQSRDGTYSGGSYIISLKKTYISIDTIAFRNCEISEVGRCVFRGESPDDSINSGEIELIEMTNCLVHKMNSDGNEWPVFYIAHVPMYVNVRNNTFYDMPHTKSIIQMNHMQNETGRNAEITFENNTVAITFERTDGIIATKDFLGAEALFFVNNNMFISPNWADDTNQSPDAGTYATPPIVVCKGGIIEAKNNIVDSMQYWSDGQKYIDLDGEGGFLVIDTADTYKMADLDFSWSDMSDPQGNDFSYLSTFQVATAGTDGGPIGDPRWVKTLENPRTLTASANIEAATVTPEGGFYEDGASVTITAPVVDGYIFSEWKNVSDGSVISTDNPYTFNITSDMEILGEYTELVERAFSVTLSGTNSATYTVDPDKEVYFEGDVVTITLNTHLVNTFTGWSDASMDLVHTVTISGGDLALTASFNEHPYKLVWDFSHLTKNNQTFSNLAANFAFNAENPGVMDYVMNDTVRTISTRNNKFDGKEVNNGLARRTHQDHFSNPDYVFIKFSTKGLTNLKIKSTYGTDNSLFKVQEMQYSLDNITYTKFASDTVTGDINQVWRSFDGVLPAAAENKDSVFVRWIADTSSERLFVEGQETSEIEYCYISKIIVLDNAFTSVKGLTADKSFKIYAYANKLMVKADKEGIAEVYSIMGQKIKESAVNTGLNEYTGLKSGIYIVRIGSEIQKVLIK